MLNRYLRGLKNPFPGCHHIRRDPFFESLETFVARAEAVTNDHWNTPKTRAKKKSRDLWDRDDLLAVDYAFSLCCCEAREENRKRMLAAEASAQLDGADVWTTLTDVMKHEPLQVQNAWDLYQAFVVGICAKKSGDEFSDAHEQREVWIRHRDDYMAKRDVQRYD